MSVKFGLNIKGKALGLAANAAPTKRRPLLGGPGGGDDFDDKSRDQDNDESQAGIDIGGRNFEQTAASSADPVKPTRLPKARDVPVGPPARRAKARDDDPSALGNAASIHESERRAKEAIDLDSAIYNYDAAYDAMHARTVAKKAADQQDALQRRPRYMDKLFESAEVRRKDELRARDKLLQREREEEGDDFADKEKFVTSAYLAQQEETRKAEEEEKKRQELEEAKLRKTGMQGFHRQMLMEQEQRHKEAQAAMEEASKGGAKPQVQQVQHESTAEIAQGLACEGKNVALNDDGQVVDKRQLLTAGLNVVAKPRVFQPTATVSARLGPSQDGHSGANPQRRAVRERQTALVAQQIEQAAKRKAEEDAEEQAKSQRASKSQKTEKDITSAKERYLQRKKIAATPKAARN